LFPRFINGAVRARLALAIVFLIAMPALRAQTSNQNSASTTPSSSGVDTTAEMSENPPVSGLDEPSFEPRFGTRSYLLPGVEVSEAVDSNESSVPGGNSVGNETYAVGSVDLQKLWKTHPFDLDYLGGVGWYTGPYGGAYQLQSLAATQRFLWRTGQLALRDSFGYLPEGTFGFDSFGGAGAFLAAGNSPINNGGGVLNGSGIPGGGGGALLGFGQFGSIGNSPRISNLGVADITQYLSPRSALVITGAYGITNFTGSNSFGYLNSQEVVSQVGYNHLLSRKDQIGLMYAYEAYRYPSSGAGSLNVNVFQVMYAHRISGKLNFVMGGGPELIQTHQILNVLGVLFVPVNSRSINESGQISFNYRASSRTSLSLGYLRYVNPGSGFFAGANTDAVNLGMTHVLGRRWNLNGESGYSRNSKLQAVTASVASNAQTYHYWFAGVALRRQLSRQFGAYASYQYNAFGSGTGFCVSFSCNSYGRQIGLIGVDWTPHPIRLD